MYHRYVNRLIISLPYVHERLPFFELLVFIVFGVELLEGANCFDEMGDTLLDEISSSVNREDTCT